jgi:Gram-negative bacterial TonB protein C-terminal
MSVSVVAFVCVRWFKHSVKYRIRHMRRGWLLLIFILATAMSSSVFVRRCSAQESAPADAKHGDVVVTKLSPPTYPQLVRVAHIVGDVTVTLGIRQDGTIESSNATSGPPMLYKAALQSAQQSQFECRNCSDAITSYTLVYTFKLNDQPCCSPTADLHVTQSENHVTAIDNAICFCDPAAGPWKVRSAKCLYLWKCGIRR